ncbi:DUF2501 domain-containing protein [Acetobacter farinalis]|uniref:DUF2501 domain-containing protein n=1 Tax=Acetobacter farinalis TaxID=1260984 RepID=A0ABT3Q7R7_9PROT|nr:DUF2501 domain-containing protein [Acetobacter farinalis]MCX2561325.1 DUF2501 domain-containing protein [Acetobacter farinalis]NHO29905.1 DUF2501 domain-containing protein [Acetobacter farinalis]
MVNKKTLLTLAVTAALAGGVSSAQAQSFGSIGQNALSAATGSMKSSAAGMLGNMLPSLSSASTSNLTGILGYCVQNNVLSGAGATSASSVLGTLTQQQGVTSSSSYSAGQQGLLQTGNNQMFSLANLQGQLKTKLCNMVLSKAQSLL